MLERFTQRARRSIVIGQAEAKDKVARAELERLAKELVDLEQTLLALQSLRQHAQNTYSLVPYKGRRGVNRRPLYLDDP